MRENMTYDLDREAGERELDEAASNLDATSEALIVDALNKLMKNRTTIMIAHNLAATKDTDNISVLRDGIAEASGTPEEFGRTNDYYRPFSGAL